MTLVWYRGLVVIMKHGDADYYLVLSLFYAHDFPFLFLVFDAILLLTFTPHWFRGLKLLLPIKKTRKQYSARNIVREVFVISNRDFTILVFTKLNCKL